MIAGQQHDVRRCPARAAGRPRRAPSRAARSATPMMPTGVPFVADQHRAPARRASDVERPRASPASRAAAPRTADGCRPARRTCRSTRLRRRARAATGMPAAAAIASPSAAARSTIARPIGCSERVSSDAASRKDLAPVRTPFSGNHVDDAQLPVRQRAGLVERHAAHRRQLLEVRAALDQHALARRGGQRRHDRDRRRDHQRARAGDDEQHQRPIDPRAPGPAEAAAARRRRAAASDEHRRRVDAREPLDERLARRALRLRALDEMDDARERRVAAQPRHVDFERAAAVDRAGEHLVARRLLDRQRLAGHRRLVDVARRRRSPGRRAGSSRRAGR